MQSVSVCVRDHRVIVRAKVVKKGGQIMLTAKAYNGRVIVEWLSRCLQDCAQNHADERLALLSSCACLALEFSTVQVIHVCRMHAHESIWKEMVFW